MRAAAAAWVTPIDQMRLRLLGHQTQTDSLNWEKHNSCVKVGPEKVALTEDETFSSPSLLIVPHPVIQAVAPASYTLLGEAKQIGVM